MAPEVSRRRVLAVGAAAAGVAATGSLLPPSLQQAMAAEAARPAHGKGGLRDIRHVVVLMQENRSFDHYFGMLRGVRGYADRNAVELPGGKSVYEQPGPLGVGTVLPFSVREAAAAQKKDLQYIGALDHGWDGGSKAWNGGWMNNWVTAKTAATMAHYDRQDVPLHYELADTFTICDAYHSSIHSSTSPNRNHLVSGWTGFEPGTGKRAVGNDAYDEDRHPGYAWTTYPERLEKAGRSWRVYQEWDNFTDNNLEFYASFKAVGKKALAKVDGVQNMTAFYGKVASANDAERKRLQGLLDEGVKALSRAERSLFERALRRGEPTTTATAFAADVASGKLPEVSYIVPSAVDSEHPGSSSPVASATIVYKVLDALGKNPDVWRHTALFLTYDENDGFFDHVPPPVPPAGTAGEFWDGRPTGLGMRVPMIVISPWTVGGYACSQVFDHTSITRFLEKWTGIREPNISAWRRTVCGDLTGAFDFSRGRRQPSVERPGAIPAFSGRWAPRPPARQALPQQESGSRPARPLPYQPDADGGFDARASVFRLAVRNAGKSAAHLALYPYAKEYEAPQHRDVLGKSEWDVPVKGGAYRFTVTGPNGFRREFAGTAQGAAAATKVRTHLEAGRRELHLTVVNGGRTDLTITLKPLAYADTAPRTVRVRAGSTRTLAHPTAGAHGWYDLDLTAAEDPSFHRRLMGHVENGRESVTG
ncbi:MULTISPECIES: phosphocholine-specific phospholipase C [Streptomyces]|uniref:phosphocholine-specific phospholipase C n=1 Tax=Streptomyces TaxID=1883 RepID=UPI00069C9409|nr:phospholipase C, phosphocholine-specific [Streptomyces kasugaensis]MYU53883.1 phospholipase C, phosphocholine-specific [Streptomyces sp. SID7805]WSK15223.1 phospholipase C, phosphocholine-specific [Streptomyces celluloflavus]